MNAGTELLRLTLEHNIGREGTFVERYSFDTCVTTWFYGHVMWLA